MRCLQEEGVEYVFGYPGGAVLFLYDELFKQNKVKHVLVRHEQGAIHAADGYSRSTDKVGVALVTSGPGVTNAVTGIATAYMDSIPLVIITGPGADPRHRPGRISGVRHGRHHAAVREAQLSREGREGPRVHDQESVLHREQPDVPGPVVVDIPKDVTSHKTEFEYPDKVSMRSYNPVVKGHAGQIKKAIQVLTEREASDGLHRRRRHPRRRRAAADAARAPARVCRAPTR